MDFAYVVITCEKYYSKRLAIEETWGKDRNVIFLDDHMTMVQGYPSCPYKYAEFFRIYEEEFDRYVFVDDDTFVNCEALEREFGTMPPEPTVIGDWRNLKDRVQPKLEEGKLVYQGQCAFPRGGAGFVINQPAFIKLKDFVRSRKDLPIAYNSDVTIGVWMQEIDIIPHRDKRFIRYFPERPEWDQIVRGELFSCHYVSPRQMVELHEAIQRHRGVV